MPSRMAFGTTSLAALSPGTFSVQPTPTTDAEGYTVIDARNVFGAHSCATAPVVC